MVKRRVKRATVVCFFNNFLSQYSGTLKDMPKMKKNLEVALKKFKEEDL